MFFVKDTAFEGHPFLAFRRMKLFASAIMLSAVLATISGCASTAPKPTAHAPETPKKRVAPHKPQKQIKETAKATFQKTSLIWADQKGRKVIEATCKSATFKSEKDGVAELKDVNAKLFRKGVPASILVAPHVIAYNSTRRIVADGGVVIKSKDTGISYRSDKLVWDSTKDKVIGTGNVKMTKKNLSVKANAFTSDTALENADFSEAKLNVK